LAKEEVRKLGSEEEKKENGTNGKYRYEARHDGCPHMKSFCGVQGRFLQKEPLVEVKDEY
jgi:hypothetical protein